MNFLAHAFLSDNNPDIMTGNFMGDFVKGNPYEQFERSIAIGVEMHRKIDDFTDHHEIVKESKNRLWPKYRHYAAVIVDIYYDHFLAKNFGKYSKESLEDFSQKVYQIMNSHLDILPKRTKFMLPYMQQDNWLYHYQSMWGIAQALNGMSRRSRFDSKMDESIGDLEQYYEQFEAEFFAFFPLLQEHCRKFLEEKKNDRS